MIAAQRRKLILDSLRADGAVSIRLLVKLLDASAVTVRRDLDALDSLHLITRTHGGAIDRQPTRESSYAEKVGQAMTEKREIGRLAATIVRDGDVIIIGPGTTTEALAHALLSKTGLTIVTNSLPVAETFAESPENQVIMTGGTLRGPIRALVGDATQQTLRGVHADIAFLSGNGLVADFGLSTPNLTVADTDRAMAAAGRQIVVLADHTKIGARTAIQTVPTSAITHVVTDGKSSAEELRQIADLGVKVHVCGISTGLLNTI